jgi:hypothetical protein
VECEAMKTIQHQQEGTVRSYKLIRRFSSLFIACLLFVQILSLGFITQTFSAERNINIGVDYRIELLTIMQYLGGYNYSSKPLSFAYKKEVDKYFNPYKGQDSVRKVMEFKNHSKYRNTSVSAVVFFSQPPELKQLVPFTPDILDQSGGEKSLTMFVEALRSFAKASNFIKFMDKQQDFFQTIKEQTQLGEKSSQYLQQLELYYGIQQHSYNIVLAPFVQCGGFGPSIEYEDGSRDIFSIIGPCSVVGDIPYFLEEEDFEELIFHEFSHSFVNPLSDRYSKEVTECSKLYTPIAKEMENMRYGEWVICLNEHLVRTFTTRIAAINQGEEEALKQEALEIRYGFVYLPLLLEQYKMYETNRSTYKTYKEFYPYLLGYLKELSIYPSIPTYFEIYTTDDNEIGLKWKDNAKDEKGYRIYRTEDQNEMFTVVTEIEKNSSYFADSTAEPGKTYWYKVSAFNDNGEMFTPILSLQAPLIEPKGVKDFRLESVKGQTVSFLWDYNSFCHGYILYEIPEKIEIERLNSDKRSVQLNHVSFGEHQYQLFAYNEWEGKRKLSREKSIVSVVVLQPPQDLRAKASGIDSIELSWSLSSDKVDRIEVYRKSENEEYKVVKELGYINQFSDSSLSPDTEYEYKLVVWIGSLICSDASESVKVRTEAKKEPEPPREEKIVLRFRVGNKTYYVNEETKEMDVAPLIMEGRVFLPIRYVTNPIGAEIMWDAQQQKTTIQLNTIIIELWIGKPVAKINGVDTPIDANNKNIKPVIITGRTFLPLRFVGESLGCEIQWDATAQEATLTYKKLIGKAGFAFLDYW